MSKVKCLYRRRYGDNLIEVKQTGWNKISLYVNNIEKDYFRAVLPKKWILKSKLENGIVIKIIYKIVNFRDTITVFVDNTQIDYIKQVKEIKG